MVIGKNSYPVPSPQRCTELVEVSPVPSDALSLSKCPQSLFPAFL
ncbi:hypothetical protein [Sphaerospermopsis sp. LEGE 00249]|nr:hypothetical protein [Sphaerospermopsis sp. LEGE 00249]